MNQAGVPDYNELVFVANADALDTQGPVIRRFMTAMRRGQIVLKRNPSAGVDALVKANRDLDPKLQTASVKVTLPYFAPPPGKPYGWQDPGKWSRFAAWMEQNNLIKGNAIGASTNRFLPGQDVG
jgi:putative hydroxymethylpyrimidine transport system substrate-binding protein